VASVVLPLPEWPVTTISCGYDLVLVWINGITQTLSTKVRAIVMPCMPHL
jgi:hypothetical protein